jgi:hypothetical protein
MNERSRNDGVTNGDPASLHSVRQQLLKGFINWLTHLQKSRNEFLANGGLDRLKKSFCTRNNAAQILPLEVKACDQACVCRLRKPRCNASMDSNPRHPFLDLRVHPTLQHCLQSNKATHIASTTAEIHRYSSLLEGRSGLGFLLFRANVVRLCCVCVCVWFLVHIRGRAPCGTCGPLSARPLDL